MNNSIARDIRRFEERIGCELPEDYRAFLRAGSCSRLTGRTVPIDGLLGGSDVSEVLGFGEELDLFWHLDMDLPRDSIAIATDSGGALYCLQVRGDGCGRVSFQLPFGGGCFEVADSFTEFVNKLRDDN